MPEDHAVESRLDAVADASVDAARVFHLAARYCRSDLLAVSLDRRAMDHEAHAQALRMARAKAPGVGRIGSLAGAVRCRWLQLQMASGLSSEGAAALCCAVADRRLLAALDRALAVDAPAAVTRIVERHRAHTLRQLPASSPARAVARMGGA